MERFQRYSWLLPVRKMLPWLSSSELSKIAILSMAVYCYWCNTFYYNQMQFQLACSTRRMQMHIYPLLYYYRTTYIYKCIFHIFPFVLHFWNVWWRWYTLFAHLLHNCSQKPIFTRNQDEVFQDSFIKAGNCVSLCALLTPFNAEIFSNSTFSQNFVSAPLKTFYWIQRTHKTIRKSGWNSIRIPISGWGSSISTAAECVLTGSGRIWTSGGSASFFWV